MFQDQTLAEILLIASLIENLDVYILQTGVESIMETWRELDMVNSLTAALGIIAENWYFLLAGIAVGMILGIIPGLGGLVALTILLPFTIFLDQYQAFTMLSGAVGATTFCGSLTAILINTPGTSSNAATMIDGYPLTQQGRANEAILASAVSSAAGAVLAIILFIALLPIVAEFVLMFGPSEIFWLIAITLVIIPITVANRPVYGIMTAMLGAIFALVGTSPQIGEPRFTMGIPILSDGVDLMAMIIGMFAIAEVVRLTSLGSSSIVDSEDINLSGNKMEGFRQVIRHKWVWLQGSLTGLFVGAIPGAGAATSAFLAYANAIQMSDEPEKFGSGAIEGVIAAEAANDAKDGGQLFPTLGLGIPGSGAMAVFLAGLLVHGIFPSPSLLVDETQLVFVIVISILIANITTSAIGVSLVNQIVKLTRVHISLLFVLITSLSLCAVLITRNQPIDMFFALFFTILGVLFIGLGISRIPFLIAFVLVGIGETNYHFAVALSGETARSAMLTGSLNITLSLVFIASLLYVLIPSRHQKRFRAYIEDRLR